MRVVLSILLCSSISCYSLAGPYSLVDDISPRLKTMHEYLKNYKDFKYFSSTADYKIYYSPSSIQPFNRLEYSDSKVNRIILRFDGPKANIYEYFNIDCTRNEVDKFSRIIYDKQGNPLPLERQSVIAISHYQKINPNTIIDNLKGIVCSK